MLKKASFHEDGNEILAVWGLRFSSAAPAGRAAGRTDRGRRSGARASCVHPEQRVEASRAALQVCHTSHTHGSRDKLCLCTQPSPGSLPRFSEPGARAMPPLTGVGERYAPRATWSCIDEPLKPAGRSRSASLPIPVKGQAWRHRLLRAVGMNPMTAPPRSLKLPGMLDEPIGSLPLPHASSTTMLSLLNEHQPPSVDQGQDERARTRPPDLLRGLDLAWP